MADECPDCGRTFPTEHGRLTHQGKVHGTPSGRRIPRKASCRCPACGDVHRRLPKYHHVRTFDLNEPPVSLERPPRLPVAITAHGRITGPGRHTLGTGKDGWFSYQERPPVNADCSCIECGHLHRRRDDKGA